MDIKCLKNVYWIINIKMEIDWLNIRKYSMYIVRNLYNKRKWYLSLLDWYIYVQHKIVWFSICIGY